MQIAHHISLPADSSEIKVKLLNMAYTAFLRLPPTPIAPASPPLHHTPASHYPKCNLLVEDREERLFISIKFFLHWLSPLWNPDLADSWFRGIRKHPFQIRQLHTYKSALISPQDTLNKRKITLQNANPGNIRPLIAMPTPRNTSAGATDRCSSNCKRLPRTPLQIPLHRHSLEPQASKVGEAKNIKGLARRGTNRWVGRRGNKRRTTTEESPGMYPLISISWAL